MSTCNQTNSMCSASKVYDVFHVVEELYLDFIEDGVGFSTWLDHLVLRIIQRSCSWYTLPVSLTLVLNRARKKLCLVEYRCFCVSRLFLERII